MAQQLKQIKAMAGAMNLDDPNEVIGAAYHKNARNVVFRGNPGNMRVETSRGNIVISNPNLPVTGTNVTIGAWYDQKRQRLFFFNYNSTGAHAIYIYQSTTGTITQLIKNGVGANSNCLAFGPAVSIIHVGMIYGDSQQGDILYFIDSARMPCKINVDRQLAGGYGTVKRSYLDVAKEPPDIPPQATYEDDPTVTVNNMRKKLFIFKYRFWFDDNDKSVWSQWSELPLPLHPFDKTTDGDPTKNSDIALLVQTGEPNVKKIEISAAVNVGNLFSDFFSIAVLEKSVLNIPSNDTYLYRFYNDKQYNNVETNTDPLLNESILLFDLVPQNAQAMEILNGNTLIYGNITEGYPNITTFTNGTNTTAITSTGEDANRSNAFFLFFATQFGKTVGYTDTDPIHIAVAGDISLGDVFTVFMQDATNISYTAIAGDNAATVILGLRAAAITAGYSVVSSNTNNLYIVQTGKLLAKFQANKSTNLDVSNTSIAAYDWASRYDFGIVYYDPKGRTNGVVTTSGMSVQSINYSEVGSIPQLPKFNLSIYHRPPAWAYYYSIVRTKNLSKSKFVQWISDRTLKDNTSSSTDTLFAYVSIENLNTFVSDNPGSPLTYQFSANDRIRFYKLFNTALGNPTYTDKDFEIQNQVLNPTINGVQYTGQFIKFILPPTSPSFDFGTSGSNFNNYFIELYTPAQPVQNGLDSYFEYSERYEIINPASGTQSHQGEFQNQTADLSLPAVFDFDKGDDYYRTRSINTGIEMVYQIEAGFGADSDAGRVTLGCALQSSSYNDVNIVTGNSPYNNLTGFDVTTNNDRWIINVISGTYLFRIKGTLTITFTDDRSDDQYMFALQKNTLASYTLVPPFDSSRAGTYSFPVDTYFDMEAGDKIFIFGLSLPDFDHTRTMSQTQLTITSQQFFTQGMIDPNFSDYYTSAVNSNGRALVINPDAATVTYPTLMRWGQSYQVDTNINQSNRFYTTSFDTIDRSKGSIQKFKVRDRILRVFQERACAQAGIFTKFIQDSGGTNTLTTTDDIITANNIQYYSGELGVGVRPESLVHGKIQDYFVDYIRGYQCRLSNDGIIPISELYKGEYFIRNLLTPYQKTYPRTDGGFAKILGTYDPFEEQYICALQGGTGISPNTFAFNEKRNAYTTFYDYFPEWISTAEDTVYTWLNGNLYAHIVVNNGYCVFYDVQRTASIDFVFNDKEQIKKIFDAVSYQAASTWESPAINTSFVNQYTRLQQFSFLKPYDFEVIDNVYCAALLRDTQSMQNTQIALLEGDYLIGNWVQIRYTYTANAFNWLYAPELIYQLNPKN